MKSRRKAHTSMIGNSACATASQPPDEIDNDCNIDCNDRHLKAAGPVDQFVNLDRKKGTSDNGGKISRPAFLHQQSDTFSRKKNSVEKRSGAENCRATMTCHSHQLRHLLDMNIVGIGSKLP